MNEPRRGRHVEGYVGAAGSTWLFKGERSAIADRRFYVDCLRITLEQVEPAFGSLAKQFHGPGSIRQMALGGFEIVTYAVEVSEPGANWHPRSARAGLLPKQCFFRLTANDVTGRVWVADHVVVHTSPQSDARGTVVRCHVGELRSEFPAVSPRSNDYLELEFFSDLRFPANSNEEIVRTLGDMPTGGVSRLNTALFRADRLTFSITRHTDDLFHLVCSDESGGKLPARLALRVCEALQFTFGRLIHWSVSSEKRGDIDVLRIADYRGADGTVVGSPLDGRYASDYDAVWSLYAAYLHRVIDRGEGDYHQVSSYWDDILRVSPASFDTAALVYSAATEGLALLVERPKTDIGELKRWHSQLRQFLKTEACPEQLRNRFDGTFGAMLKPSAREALEWLADNGLVLRPDVAAWSDIRHKFAHGGRAGSEHEELDATASRTQRIRRLAAWIIFAIIGYERPGGGNEPLPIVERRFRYARMAIRDRELVEVRADEVGSRHDPA